MKNDKDKYESIATKIGKEKKKQLDLILEQLGMNYYQWFQLMAEVTVRIADDRHNLSEEMAKLIQMFQLVPGWSNPVTFCDPNNESELHAALYFVKQNGKKGLKPVLTEKGWMDGIWQTTENVQDIVEYVIESCMPTSYKWLRQRMVEMQCNRVFECLLKMADDATAERMNEEIREMFGDNSRHDYGRNIELGKRYKRVKHRTPDSLANSQQTIHFRPEDTPTGVDGIPDDGEAARQWLIEHEDGDERPFGMEY